MSASEYLSKLIGAVNSAHPSAAAPARLCVVGVGPNLARVVAALSAGAADVHAGLSDGIDALVPADFPQEERLIARWDLLIFVAAGCAPGDVAESIRAVRGAGRPVLALVEPGAPMGWVALAGVQEREIVRGVGGGAPSLEGRVVCVLGDDALSLALRYPLVRRAYCEHVVLTNAKQNAAIGAIVVLPGADMPAMTANQIRMVLKIAVAYGEEIGPDRALELLSVIGGGLALRTLTRQALGFVPGLGWAIKGAVGFTATVALGKAAIAYFESGAPLQLSHMQRITPYVDRLRSRVPGVLQRALPTG